MKLEFTLLVVDDTPNSIEQAISALREHLEDKGFALRKEVEKDFSDQSLSKLAQLQGQNYDLVIVDFNLGLEEMNGAEVARKLRTNLPFTDMVFYSSLPAANLLGELAKHKVPGVFTATRAELDDSLRGLADTVIGKAIDLNHMRGIAMAEVAEMDMLMQETLACAFESSDENVASAADRTIAKLQESICRNRRELKRRLEESGVAGIARDGRLFPHTQKYWAIRRLANCLTQTPSEDLLMLQDYEDDVVKNRNLLAHAKEHSGEHGRMELRSINDRESPIIINEEWMTNFRRKLQEHRRALTVVCAAIRTEFGRQEDN